MFIKRLSVVATALSVSLTGVSLADMPAETPAIHWEQAPDIIATFDGSDAGKRPDSYSFIRIISVTGGTGPIVKLSCQATDTGDNALNVGIQLDPTNNYEEDPQRTLRILTMSGVLTIDGKRESERFRYHPASSKIIPFDRAVARRLFNAVVRGDEVKLKALNTSYDLELPGKDDVFTAFAKICPVTNGGHFDYSILEHYKGKKVGISSDRAD